MLSKKTSVGIKIHDMHHGLIQSTGALVETELAFLKELGAAIQIATTQRFLPKRSRGKNHVGLNRTSDGPGIVPLLGNFSGSRGMTSGNNIRNAVWLARFFASRKPLMHRPRGDEVNCFVS